MASSIYEFKQTGRTLRPRPGVFPKCEIRRGLDAITPSRQPTELQLPAVRPPEKARHKRGRWIRKGQPVLRDPDLEAEALRRACTERILRSHAAQSIRD